MARGFSSAPGASADLVEASAGELERARMLVLGTSKNGLVRAAIAERVDCPFGLMVTLAHDYSADVRCAVASNPRAQRSVFQYLAADRAVPVALALIGNPALPKDILEELAFHRKSEVRAAATLCLDTGLPGADEDHAEDARTPELAEHGSMALDVERSLGSDVWSRWVDAVAASPVDESPRDSSVTDDAASPAAELRVAGSTGAQFFSQSAGQEGVGATRTAPVRGFRAPES